MMRIQTQLIILKMSNVVKAILFVFFISLGDSAFAQDTTTAADTIIPATDTAVFDGRYIAKHDNGKVAVEGVYDNGTRVGTWKEFDEAGTLRKATKYKKGKVKSIVEYDAEGNMTQLTNKKGKVKKVKDCHCSDRAN